MRHLEEYIVMKDDAKRIALLRGDPKKSVMQIALPVMVTMIFTSLYNVIDGIWIAGLGNSALAGIGIVTPLWMIINGVSNGLAHGATSTISRYAANDKEKAQKAAEHAIMVSLTGALLLTGLLTGALFPYLTLYDIESDTRHEAICYSIPLFLGLSTHALSCGLAGILRAEGDTKRPMYAITTGVVLNALLDPVFIYVLGWGSAGAAISTIVTTMLSAFMMFYWIFVMKKSYLRLRLGNIARRHYDKEIINDILKTGIPASFELLMLSLASVLFYSFISAVGGDQGAAIYSSGYRLYLIDLMPISSISLASIAIFGTHYGAKNPIYLRRTHTYCCMYAFIIALVTTLLINLFPHEFASLFALTSDDTQLIDGISHFIRITAFCMPFLALGLPSTFMYLGLGKGKMSLMWTTINEIVCAVPATYILGVVMGYGLTGIWLGFVVGRGIACTCNFCVSRYYLRRMEREMTAKT